MDLNCDLAEGEPPSHTAAFMALVSSANVACAGHAGSRESMRHALDLGLSLGVNLGAHPGLPGNFGRSQPASFTPQDLRHLLDDQVGRFLELAATAGARLHHVKLHGALYHATENDPALRNAFIAWVLSHTPHAIVFALAGGKTTAAARLAGLTAWDEAFADRAYLSDGSLAPRSHPNALLTTPAAVTARVSHLLHHSPIPTLDGPPLLLLPQTLCLHSDSPHSLHLLQAARTTLPPPTP
jgi:UPF0271 protein